MINRRTLENLSAQLGS